ncbi:class I SAM-dependent methyltransferase [Pseudochelatococcus sp. G4_1912]|uniref:class I SAM-dependent methyltransferase n=1 Tax=Pseudochelatococcus sp. G4_1912 TaxID=3114288 RepID=UPI0039C5AFAE
MPHSYSEHKDWMLEKYLALKPDCVIDIGVGAGTYAKLMRPHFRAFWTGIEVWAPYIEQFDLKTKYDQLIVADILHLDFSTISPRPTLAIAGDVLEHIPKDTAKQQIARIKNWVDDLLISIPLGEMPQDSVGGNWYERHLATWEHDEMVQALGDGVVDAIKGKSLGAYHWSRKSV